MNLPDDRNERIKIFALAAIVTIIVIVVIVMFVIIQQRDSRAKAVGGVAKLDGQIRAGNTKIKRAIGIDDRCAIIRDKLLEFDKEHVFDEEFGVYRMNVEEYLVKIQKELGIPFGSVRKLALTSVPPKRKRDFPHVLNSYTTLITMDASYAEVVKVVRKLENDNPYMSVLAVNISPKNNDRDKHTVRLKVDWPVWRNPEIVNSFIEKDADQ